MMDRTRYPTKTASRDARHSREARARGDGAGVGRPRRRTAVAPADGSKLLRRLILPTILAAVVLLVGLPTPLGQAVFVTVNGVPAAVTPGSTVADVTMVEGVSTRPGALVDIAGDVIRPVGGEPGVVRLDGAGGLGQMPLTDGDAVVAHRGRDVSEPLERREASIPYDLVSEGSGPVLAVAQAGRPGVKAVYSGRSSDRVVVEYVAESPVDAVLRRSKGLSPGQKAVALTFDDGPSGYTRDILDVLAAKGATATFFWVGKTAAGNGSLLQAARSAGHSVENHSWSHADLTKLSPEGVRAEITKASSTLGGTHFLRPPYGSYNASVAEQAGLLGQRLALWDVDTLDWKTRDAAAILTKVKEQTRPGAIILMHDGGGDRSQTVAALPAVIDWLLSQGYAITTLDRLAG